MTLDPRPVLEPESLVEIRFQDCDPFGHLNNARYIDYFFNARTDHLAAHYGFHMFAHGRASGAGWVVKQTQIAYLRPALPSELVLIRTRLIHFDATDLVVEGLMLDRAGRQLKSAAWAVFTYVSLGTGRPAQHPDELMRFFESIQVAGGYAADGFNQRVTALRTEFRRRPAEAEAAPAAV